MCIMYVKMIYYIIIIIHNICDCASINQPYAAKWKFSVWAIKGAKRTMWPKLV